MSVKNLGQVSAIHIGTSAPTNKNLIWRDLSVSPNLWKIWNSQTSLWETVPSEIAQSITANLVFDNVAAIQNILGYKNNDTVIDKATNIVYRFSSISVATPVANLIIKPTNIVSGAGRWIKSFSIIEEAPIDGVQYVRQDGGWVTFDADDIDDTSTTNKFLTSTEKTDLLNHIDSNDNKKHETFQIIEEEALSVKLNLSAGAKQSEINSKIDSTPFTALEWQYNSAAFVSDLTAGQFQFNADKTILYLSYVLNPNVGLSNTIQNYVEGIKSGSKFIFRDSTGKILELVTTSDSAQVGASIFAQMGCTVLNDSGIGNGLNCVVEIAGVGGGAGLTPEEAADLAAATEHIDGADEKKHGSEQITNAAALANIDTAANAKVSAILAAINTKIASLVDLSEIDVSDINIGEKKIIVAIKNSEGLAEFGGAIGLLDAIANPGVEGLLGETAAWIADEITLTGNNLNGSLGENSQMYPGLFDFYVCITHDNGTTISNGSATWRRYRSMDCLNIAVSQHATIIGQLETEAGWNAGAQFKQIAAKSKRGTWFRRPTGGYLFMCIDDSNGWTRVGTPPTISLEITAASHPVLTTSLNAHDFTVDRFYLEGTNASDEPAGQGQQYWNTTTKNVFQRDMLGNWAKLN